MTNESDEFVLNPISIIRKSMRLKHLGHLGQWSHCRPASSINAKRGNAGAEGPLAKGSTPNTSELSRISTKRDGELRLTCRDGSRDVAAVEQLKSTKQAIQWRAAGPPMAEVVTP